MENLIRGQLAELLLGAQTKDETTLQKSVRRDRKRRERRSLQRIRV